MLPYLTLFSTSFVVAFSGAMMPGPLMTATLSESSRNGPWVGPKMIAGHALLEMALLTALLFGMAPLFKKEFFFILVAFIGGILMIWMAQSMFRSIPKLEINAPVDSGKRMNHYLAGILLSLANPYWIIWWATIGLGYVMNAQKFGIPGIFAFFTGHILGDLVWYTSLSVAIGKGKRFFTRAIYRILLTACATFLVLFALWLIYGGIRKILTTA